MCILGPTPGVLFRLARMAFWAAGASSWLATVSSWLAEVSLWLEGDVSYEV